MAASGLRVAVIGATGAVGSEVLAVLADSSLRVGELVPLSTDRSLGQDVEFQGETYPVQTGLRSLRGLDLMFLCAPPPASLDFAREALRAQVACIDLSGALLSSADVPLRVAAFGAPPGGEPLVSSPPGGVLAWALVLRPLREHAGLRRVAGTVLEAASVGGRSGIESLFSESLAIFNQDELPEPTCFPRPIAFDCIPAVGPIEEGGATEREQALLQGLERLFGADARFAATLVQVPTFVGHGTVLGVETDRPLDPKRAEELLAKAPGVEVWEEGGENLTTRAATGRDVVLVGRLRRDPSAESGLLLWLAADVLRLAASNAVQLAVARLRRH